MGAQFRVRGQQWLALLQVLELRSWLVVTLGWARLGQLGGCRGVGGVGYVFHQDGALVATPVAMSQRRHKAAGIDFEQRLRLRIGIDFDVLVVELLQFERDPDTLDEGTGWR